MAYTPFDAAFYHKSSHSHPTVCPGCTSNKSLWGKPIKEKVEHAKETKPFDYEGDWPYKDA